MKYFRFNTVKFYNLKLYMKWQFKLYEMFF